MAHLHQALILGLGRLHHLLFPLEVYFQVIHAVAER
jgi:hypothetical protein